MKDQIITTLSAEELQNLIQESVKSAINEALSIKEGNNGQKFELMSRQEAAAYLKISLVTLHDWTKHHIVKSYKLGGRIYYDKTELFGVVKRGDFN